MLGRGRGLIPWLIVVAGLLALTVMAWTLHAPDAGNANLQDRVLAIASQLRAPGDENTLTVAQSSAQNAQHMRFEIQQELLGGKSERQIIADMVKEYGPDVLAAPAARGVGLLLWLFPVAFVLSGALAVAFALRRRTHESMADGARAMPCDQTESASSHEIQSCLKDYL